MDAMLNRWKIARKLPRHAIAGDLLMSQIEISLIPHQLRQQKVFVCKLNCCEKWLLAPLSLPCDPNWWLNFPPPAPDSNCCSLPAPNVLKWKCLWLTFILLCFIRHVRLCFFVSILILFEQRQNKGRSMNVNDTISEEKLIAILALRIKCWKHSHSTQQGRSSLEQHFSRKDCSFSDEIRGFVCLIPTSHRWSHI